MCARRTFATSRPRSIVFAVRRSAHKRISIIFLFSFRSILSGVPPHRRPSSSLWRARQCRHPPMPIARKRIEHRAHIHCLRATLTTRNAFDFKEKRNGKYFGRKSSSGAAHRLHRTTMAQLQTGILWRIDFVCKQKGAYFKRFFSLLAAPPSVPRIFGSGISGGKENATNKQRKTNHKRRAEHTDTSFAVDDDCTADASNERPT